jgi:hypothetical protein
MSRVKSWLAFCCEPLLKRRNIQNTMKDTTISFKIERSLKVRLYALAREENRSLSNLIVKILKEKLAEHESKRSRAKGGE